MSAIAVHFSMHAARSCTLDRRTTSDTTRQLACQCRATHHLVSQLYQPLIIATILVSIQSHHEQQHHYVLWTNSHQRRRLNSAVGDNQQQSATVFDCRRQLSRVVSSVYAYDVSQVNSRVELNHVDVVCELAIRLQNEPFRLSIYLVQAPNSKTKKNKKSPANAKGNAQQRRMFESPVKQNLTSPILATMFLLQSPENARRPAANYL